MMSTALFPFTLVEFFHIAVLGWLAWAMYQIRWSGRFAWVMDFLTVGIFALAAVVVALDYVGG